MTPQWFSNPNDVLSEQDIRESLEYEKVLLARIERECEHETTQLDLSNSRMRIRALERSLIVRNCE